MTALIDLTGQRFGMLTVSGRAGNDAQGRAVWTVVCDCGAQCTVASSDLRRTDTRAARSCGCQRTRTLQMIGQRFGRLTVIERGVNLGKEAGWVVQCDCGATKTVVGSRLRAGLLRSCGCLARDTSAERLRREVVGYSAAHWRVRTVRGNANEHTCVDCGGPANEWSYDHADPGELVDEDHGHPFSLDPQHYEPRCNACHIAFDSITRKANQ